MPFLKKLTVFHNCGKLHPNQCEEGVEKGCFLSLLTCVSNRLTTVFSGMVSHSLKSLCILVNLRQKMA